MFDASDACDAWPSADAFDAYNAFDDGDAFDKLADVQGLHMMIIIVLA